MPASFGRGLCRELNNKGARYLVIGGFAIRSAGYIRETMDVDLLVDASLENEALVYAALESLPDQAVKELDPGREKDAPDLLFLRQQYGEEIFGENA